MYIFRFQILLLSFVEFSDFVHECFRIKIETVRASETSEFFDFRKPSGYKIENETTKEGLFVTFWSQKVRIFAFYRKTLE